MRCSAPSLVRHSSCWLLLRGIWMRGRRFVNLPRHRVPTRSGACTLALRACFGVVHLHAPSGWVGSAPWLIRCCLLLALAPWLSVPSWQNQNIARSLNVSLHGIWVGRAASNLLGHCVLMRAFCLCPCPAAVSHVMAAGHNSRLQKMAFAFCCVVARRQPWLRFHCTAAAGRGIMMRAFRVAGATSEAQAVRQTGTTS